ncbi:uncharacterized protein LOC104582914 isoform X1 [Brachypodium distachyon]|uniref:DUF3615 domain-containing protein n=1 Tax=Brachypodium distachyon TaxID=15368 RepID=A0A2K2DGC5_BRADI|nr:uncharacterized protein LOC104582914 isoform X1 [Brachypodium distachyon]PNT73320.1 hypothetical protein BRADI_2g56980v3 [Brachypodium distachyon]|eukprot:XP_014754379.1 uncharacterized protein LOC104582914 isoform X1 [Brachypodium distachyon]
MAEDSFSLHLAGAGSWSSDSHPIPERMPLHFTVPIDPVRGALLISVDGDGNRTQIHTPPIPVIHGGRLMATTPVGSGPLIFVDKTDEFFTGDYPVPAGNFTASSRLIAATCAALRRPCPHFALSEDEDEGGEHIAAELQPPAQQPGSDWMKPDGGSSSKGLLKTPSCKVTSPTCPQAPTLSPGSSSIFAKLRSDWGTEFYIRVDREGLFHTYPDVGGPFQSTEQAENAIDRYLHGRRDPSMCEETAGVSEDEMVIRQCVFWPDGTWKRRTKSYVLQKVRDQMRELVHAVVDQYNKDHNLTGDYTYELKDIMQHEHFRENNMGYRHLNFIAKTKVDYDDDGGQDDYVVDPVAVVAAVVALDGDDDFDDDYDLDCWIDKIFIVELRQTKQEGINGSG